MRAGETAAVSEGDLVAAEDGKLARKGPDLRAPLSIWSPPRGTRWLLALSVGVGGDSAPTTQRSASFDVGAALWFRITERLSWSVPWPAFSYRFGTPGRVEVIPYLGLTPLGFGTTIDVGLTGEVAARIWTTRTQQIIPRAGLLVPSYHDPGSPLDHVGMGHDLDPFGSVGYAWTLNRLVSIGGDVGLDRMYALPLGAAGPWQTNWELLRLDANVHVRLAPRVGMQLRGEWNAELVNGPPSYPGFHLGTTVAF